MEIARYILSHTVSLEKIIVNPHHPFIVTIEDTDEQLKATSRARQHLEHRLPPGAQLVIGCLSPTESAIMEDLGLSLAEVFSTAQAIGMAGLPQPSHTFTFTFQFLGFSMDHFSYSVICDLAVVFIAKLVPETKGQALEEIHASFTNPQRRNSNP
ncbi:sugar transporter erd6-like 8 [Quercus suber]|uniref:Sugar transporter erd6-like 8 n=1 Tax=Quercus suber TaxID=58331 RepID=A0AAW0JW04_QUESU